jgi:hypothetical protein
MMKSIFGGRFSAPNAEIVRRKKEKKEKRRFMGGGRGK